MAEPASDEAHLRALLDHMAAADYPAAGEWADWRFGGGANNLLYRLVCLDVWGAAPTEPPAGVTARGDDVERQGECFAAKFTIRDERDRAGREFAALSALCRAGLDLAPAPLLLERDRYAHPVIVQTWLAGEVSAEAPDTDLAWDQLVEHLAAIHDLPFAFVPAQPAVLMMRSAAEGLARISEQAACIPVAERPAALVDLLRQLARHPFPSWPPPPAVLCRSDLNSSNFIRRPGRWASCDWEYAGQGDAAFELADLLAHPAYVAVPPERRDWIVAAYCRRRGDLGLAERLQVYRTLMLFWWVVRFARMRYELLHGLEQRRLAQRPADWPAQVQSRYERYLALAKSTLA